MEPVGTSFQSASEERIANRTRASTSSGRISLTHQWRAPARSFSAFMTDWTPGGPRLVKGRPALSRAHFFFKREEMLLPAGVGLVVINQAPVSDGAGGSRG